MNRAMGSSQSRLVSLHEKYPGHRWRVELYFQYFPGNRRGVPSAFSELRQDIQYAEDLVDQINQHEIDAALSAMWTRPIRKQDAVGIHGTLFYELRRYKEYYSEKREDAVSASAINQAQRKLFATPLGEGRDE
jgi:hypothetical protein